MNRILIILAFLFLLLETKAQENSLVRDKEHIFRTEEYYRIDSLLRAYRQKTGNIMIVASDTLDIRSGEYADGIFRQYLPDTGVKTYAMAVLLSRRNQFLNVAVNKNVSPFLRKDRDAQLIEILGAGIPAMREKRTEEGVTMICKKSMELMDSLSRNR